MGHRGIGALGYWGIGALRHLGQWGIGALGHWGIGALGHWGIGALGHCSSLDRRLADRPTAVRRGVNHREEGVNHRRGAPQQRVVAELVARLEPFDADGLPLCRRDRHLELARVHNVEVVGGRALLKDHLRGREGDEGWWEVFFRDVGTALLCGVVCML